MRTIRVTNARTGHSLGEQVGLAERWWSRLRGLLGRPPLAPGQGLLLAPCRGVHMFGMHQPLDVAVLRLDGAVLALYPALRPGGRTAWHREAAFVLEIPAGTLDASETAEGDVLRWTA